MVTEPEGQEQSQEEAAAPAEAAEPPPAVAEPAAAGVPVLFGPRHDRLEAGELLRCAAAVALDADTAVESLRRLLADQGLRVEAGERARAWAEAGRGAAEAGAKLVLELLG
jgi:3-deoxy-D-manno-octulosonic-acid transferase